MSGRVGHIDVAFLDVFFLTVALERPEVSISKLPGWCPSFRFYFFQVHLYHPVPAGHDSWKIVSFCSRSKQRFSVGAFTLFAVLGSRWHLPPACWLKSRRLQKRVVRHWGCPSAA